MHLSSEELSILMGYISFLKKDITRIVWVAERRNGSCGGITDGAHGNWLTATVCTIQVDIWFCTLCVVSGTIECAHFSGHHCGF